MNLKKNSNEFNLKRDPQNRFVFCLAPVTAMHFGFNGKVYPCHNNNILAYGDVNKSSLKEIWEGNERTRIEKYLKNKLERAGCLQCLQDLKQNNLDAVNSLRYEPYTQYSGAKYPAVMGFRLSDACNINCVMCMSNNHIRQCKLTSSDIYGDKFFDELAEFIPHIKHAYFLGGEPFFEPLNFKVFSLINELNPDCNVTIQTNGTIFNENICEILKKGKYDINVSIDSLNSVSFESIRRGAKFEQVLDNIREFLAISIENNTSFSSCFTPMRMNWEELPEIIDFFSKELDSKIWINKFYFPVKFSLWAISHEELKRIHAQLADKTLYLDNENSKYNVSQYIGYLKVIESYIQQAYSRRVESLNYPAAIKKMLRNIKQTARKGKLLEPEEYAALCDKLDIFLTTDPKKTFYYLKQLVEVFSGDKLSENIMLCSQDFIYSDVDAIQF